MILLKKALLFSFIAILNLQASIYAMELPEANFKSTLNENDSDLLSDFLYNYRNQNYISSRSDADLLRIISLSYDVMDDPKELKELNWFVKEIVFKKSTVDIKEILNAIIDSATKELESRNPTLEQKKSTLAPILKPSGTASKISPPAQPSNASKKISPTGLVTLKKIIQAEINGKIDYIKTRSNYTLESAIELANIVLNNHAEFSALKKELKLTKKQLRPVLERVKQKASDALRLAQEKAAPEKILTSAQIAPAIIKEEEPEEEIQANQLYIGLDI